MDHSMHEGHHESHDHDKHAGHNPDMFKKKFWLSFVLTIPVLIFSETIQELFNYTAPTFPGSEWIPAILGTIIFFYGGLVFLKSAKAELSARQPGMMTLISLAITVAFGYSIAVSFGLQGMDFWWELATLVTIMLLGHWLEMASVQNAQGALKELAKLLPDEAELVTKNGTKIVTVASLKVGDLVLVRPGTTTPTDGVVIKGESKVNESMLTGESKPVSKLMKSLVIGGAINGSGALTIKVTKVGEDTALAGIMKLVADAQNSKSKTQIVADRAAFYLTFIALGAAILTAIGWTFFSDQSASFILERVVTVLVIACPHALGLAVPLVTAISTTLAAKNGLLVRERMALESARNIDVVLFDKTGTLTKGEQGVVDIITDGAKVNDVLTLAASVELESEHPIAKAIVTFAKGKKLQLSTAKKFSAMSGRGARATVGADVVHVGGPRLIEELSLKLTSSLLNAATSASNDGKTVVYIIKSKKVIGAIMLADVIRPESKEAVKTLQKAGKRVAMLTGDAKGVAAWVSKELGITEFFAEVLPEHKADVVKKLQADGSKVAIVTLSKATYRKMIQNLAWATGYNTIAIPLAAGVTAGLGFVLSPAIGAVLMSLSTIVVAVNAQFLRKLDLG